MIKKLFYKSYHLYHLIIVLFVRNKYTESQNKCIQEFNDEIIDIPQSNIVSDFWSIALLDIKDFIKYHDVRNILQSPTIKYTMVAEPNRIELRDLLNSRKSNYFKAILKEDWAGNPTPYFYYLKSSGNTIHHAYSILQLFNFVNIEFSSLNRIFEFGGGYGNFAKLIFKSNFQGNYLIYDLPLMSSIQKLFLNLSELNVSVLRKPSEQISTVSLLNDLSDISGDDPDLFVALWSLSECPFTLRDQVLSRNLNSKYFLIAYSNEFMGVNNSEYFESFRVKMVNYEWITYEIDHLKGHTYLIGRKLN